MPGPTPIPEGYEELRVERRHGERVHRDYYGYHRREEPIGYLRSRSDGRHYPFDKRDLLPERLWELHELLQQAAREAGTSYAEVLAEARRRLSSANPTSGHSRPDLTEESIDVPRDPRGREHRPPR